ncbi:MAG: hypothetical protein HY268_25310 [Deltaproteobacteria bacterium]|nr:hypothetical protein [Deltaproteobacteria bacterium]
MASLSANTLTPIRTKIVATVGPASREPAVLRKLIDAGVNVFRLNFSHGSHEEHSVLLANIRRTLPTFSGAGARSNWTANTPWRLTSGSGRELR